MQWVLRRSRPRLVEGRIIEVKEGVDPAALARIVTACEMGSE
jgi:hypothetical protein